MSLSEHVVSGVAINPIKKNRSRSVILKKISNAQLAQYQEDGWAVDKQLSTSVWVKKLKPLDLLYQDEIWLFLLDMGFTHLSKEGSFCIFPSEVQSAQQFDLFAADSETVLCIRCITSEVIKRLNLKEVIEVLSNNREDIIREIKKEYGDKKLKFKFILATKNIIISDSDSARMRETDIFNMDEECVKYYSDLAKHLGYSSRYQLLGNLFEGRKIPEIDSIVPAIEGTMGGHKYYSFSIEPYRLLKFAYILHRNKAHKKMMPTYQRLIKKSRINEIRDFINQGGFFPNSIVVDIETNGRGLRFDFSNLQYGTLSRIGLLHLPQMYKSAYIIDGQHRLYGYAQTKYVKTNSIPVIAFVDLKRDEQVRLFMEINENQKAVPKNLRNTLNSDLLWDSKNKNQQRKALKSQIAQDLGEERSSPLLNHIIVGENQKTQDCNITIDTIVQSLSMCSFFNVYKGDQVVKNGIFDNGDNDTTYNIFYPFIEQCLEYIKNSISDEWEKGDAGILLTNAGIFSLIRVINDIVEHLVQKYSVNLKLMKADQIVAAMEPYLAPLINFYLLITPQERDVLKKSYGTGGRTKYWRSLQRVIAQYRVEFQPEGLEQYWRDNDNLFNEQSFKIIRDIERFMNKDFRDKLQAHYGPAWFNKGVPRSVYDEANRLAADKNYESEGQTKVDPWDCLTLINYKEIATHSSNWQDLFEKMYTRPGEEKITGGKRAKVDWLQRLSKIRNENFHTYSVTEEEFKFLLELHNWLLKKEP